MEKEYVMITGVGNTDPMRGDFDGPIMHIVRYYKPQKVYMLLTKEIGEKEKKWKYNKKAIEMLHTDTQVICCYTEVANPQSYDDLMPVFSKWCSKISKENSESRILLNITSATPQMETTLAMIGIAEPERYVSVQVTSPEKKSNSSKFFNPEKDNLEEWFSNNFDNLPDMENRCIEPQLVNFRTPIICFQMESLIQNYDYAGALEIYNQNKGLFSEKLGLLLEHGKRRLNLEFDEAIKIAEKLNLKKELYPSQRKDIVELADYFNCMKVKKCQGELNDFMLRVEVLTQYLGLYILEKCMKLNMEDITTTRGKGNSKTYFLSKEKCMLKMPEIEEFLSQKYFFNEGNQIYEWGRALNSRVIVCLIAYLSQEERNQKFSKHAEEMLRWVKLSAELRNPAAHTIVAITQDLVRESYEGKSLDMLCRQMETVMRVAFGTEASKETFEVYEILNKLCREKFVK